MTPERHKKYQSLFEHLENEHNLTLIESEKDEIILQIQKSNKMKELKVTKDNIKSFGVQCPKDVKTNTKWKEIIDWFNFIYEGLKWNGKDEGNFYGIDRGKMPWTGRKQNIYDEILSIEQAHTYFFAEEKQDVVLMGNSLEQGWVGLDINAHELASKEMQNIFKDEKTTFQILTEAGFKRVEMQNKVFFDKFGYYPFRMEWKIMKGVKYIWVNGESIIRLQVMTKNGNIKSQHILPIEKVLEDIKKYSK